MLRNPNSTSRVRKYDHVKIKEVKKMKKEGKFAKKYFFAEKISIEKIN